MEVSVEDSQVEAVQVKNKLKRRAFLQKLWVQWAAEKSYPLWIRQELRQLKARDLRHAPTYQQ